MGKIYLGQTDLTIELETGKNITGYTVKVGFRNPKGTLGCFDASLKDPLNGKVECIINNENQLNMSGEWNIWVRATSPSGKISIGEASKFTVYQEGN